MMYLSQLSVCSIRAVFLNDRGGEISPLLPSPFPFLLVSDVIDVFCCDVYTHSTQFPQLIKLYCKGIEPDAYMLQESLANRHTHTHRQTDSGTDGRTDSTV